jgi:hypothetical protein
MMTNWIWSVKLMKSIKKTLVEIENCQETVEATCCNCHEKGS